MNELTSSDTQSNKTNNLHELFAILDSRFNNAEIKDLCFHLGIDYENLPGSTRTERVQELLLFTQRRDGLESLVAIIEKTRPDIFPPASTEQGIEDAPGEKPEKEPRIQVVEAKVPSLLLTLTGAEGRWELAVTNESEIDLRRINVVMRPTTTVAVTPVNIPFGAISAGQTKPANNTIVIRPNQKLLDNPCILPFQVICAAPKGVSRLESEFHIPVAITD